MQQLQSRKAWGVTRAELERQLAQQRRSAEADKTASLQSLKDLYQRCCHASIVGVFKIIMLDINYPYSIADPRRLPTAQSDHLLLPPLRLSASTYLTACRYDGLTLVSQGAIMACESSTAQR